MSALYITESATVQMPMVRHAAEVGWVPVPPQEAVTRRGGFAGLLFRGELEDALRQFNPWLNGDAIRGVVERLESLPPTIEGNREMLAWLRGERQWYDEADRRHRPVMLIDFDTPGANVFQVTWEWALKPPARKGNRADVMFLVNGVPVAIVENKNPKDRDAHRSRSWTVTALRTGDAGAVGRGATLQRDPPPGLLVRRHLERLAPLHGPLEGAPGGRPTGSPSSHSLSRRTFCVPCGTGFSSTSRTGRLGSPYCASTSAEPLTASWSGARNQQSGADLSGTPRGLERHSLCSPPHVSSWNGRKSSTTLR